MIKIRPNSFSEGINHVKSGRKRNHKQGKCSLRGKMERACRPNQLLRLGTNVPSAPHSATCRLLVQLWEFPLICLTMRSLGTEHWLFLSISFCPACPILGAPVCAPGALGVLVPVAAAPRFVLGYLGWRTGICLSLCLCGSEFQVGCRDNLCPP